MVKTRNFSNITNNVYVIHDSMFPIYLIHGRKSILIDCSILAKGAEIDESLVSIMKNDRIESVLLTHSHYDHIGACSYLQGKHHFNIIASQRTKEILQNPKAIDFIDKLNQEFKRRLGKKMDGHVSIPENIIPVHEGDIIKVSSEQWLQVYETPGHSRCSLAFFLKPENILFSGDAAGIIEKNKTIKPLFLSSYSQYLESLNKITILDVDILALPHNQIIKGKKNILDFFDRSLRETIKLKDKIFRELQITTDFNAIAEKLSATEYSLPTVDGPREALIINLTAMVKSIYNEFIKKDN